MKRINFVVFIALAMLSTIANGTASSESINIFLKKVSPFQEYKDVVSKSEKLINEKTTLIKKIRALKTQPDINKKTINNKSNLLLKKQKRLQIKLNRAAELLKHINTQHQAEAKRMKENLSLKL